ncbi:M56 family metallopeptidase [Maribacter algicola]|uniref:M56 family metallopeptidase n=1 Tax=Meishania litoralis TaxID=3434685 RepID=A0ACC7LF86_9FLAO
MMEAFLIYIAKASSVLTIFFLAYFTLKSETFFRFNRYFLIFGLLSALILPLIELTRYVTVAPITKNVVYTDNLLNSTVLNHSSNLIDWTLIFFMAYLLGVAFFCAKFVLQLLSLKKMVRTNTPYSFGGYTYVRTSSRIAPFSFFKYIFYNPSLYTEKELQAILKHEIVHSSQWHSADVLLAHMVAIVTWPNPFSWLYQSIVKQNLEFIADNGVIQNTNSVKGYQYTLLKVSGNQPFTPLVNTFYNPSIKKRIVMLNKSKSNKMNILKAAVVIPILSIFLVSFNTKEVIIPTGYDLDSSWAFENPNETIEIIINKNTTDEALEKVKKDLAEKDVDFSYTVVHNDQNEIINISIQVSGYGNSGSYNSDSGNPISPIKIVIDKEKGLSIGNSDVDFGSDSFNFTIHEDEDADDDGLHEITIKKISSKKGDGTVWVQATEKDHKTVIIEETNGKEIIKVNGKEVSRETYEKMKDDDEMLNVHVRKGKKGKNVFIIKDSDDEHDIEVIDNDDNSFFFIDTDGDEEPLYIIDGKEVSEKKFKKLSPSEIEKIEVLKGDGATKKYGKKAKNGVVEITTKKKTD